MELRTRPKSDYLYAADLSELYVLAEHWKSDMDFYKDELRFLHDLVDKYFIWLTSKENIDHTREVALRLRQAEEERSIVASGIRHHLHRIGQMIVGPAAGDEQDFREEHILLEDKMTDLVKNIRALKKEVFALTEHVIESEKLQHLLTP